MKKILFLLFFPSFIFSYLGCDEEKSDPVSDTETISVNLSNDFSTTIFKAVIEEEEEDKNVVISPLSISQVLQMILAGADDNTARQIANSFGKDMTSEELIARTASFNNWLKNRGGNAEILLSNSAFYDAQNLKLLEGYKSSLSENFQAQLIPEDFSNESQALATINRWVDEKTNSRIPSILENISSDEVMFLVNALYLKADWRKGFSEGGTLPRAFTLQSGEEVQVKTMSADRSFSSYQNEDLTAVELPYKDDSLSMYLIKPTDGNVNQMISQLDAELMDDIIKNSSESRLLFSLPKFEIEYENKEMKNSLRLLGINEVFTDQANLFKMATRKDLAISRVVHKTYITVDEKGTEGAAVTAAGVVSTSLPPQVDFNSPFVFIIVEKIHNEMLFMGRVSDPR